MKLGSPLRWSLALGLALALGITVASLGCGPQEKFCPDSGDGVCEPIFEAAAPSDASDASDSALDGAEIIIGGDSSTAADTVTEAAPTH